MKNILLLKLTSLGDMAQTLPLVADLRKQYPDAKIDWVVDSYCADIPRWTIGVDRVISAPLRRFKKSRSWADFKEIAGAIWAIRKRKYDVVIDVHGVYKSAITAYLARSPRKLGYAAEFLGEPGAVFAYNEIFGPHGDATGRHKMRLVVADALGYPVEGEEKYELALPKPAAPFYNDGIKRAFLFPATSRDTKARRQNEQKWPMERWIAVGQGLAERGYRVQLPWGSDVELQTSKLLAAEIPNADIPAAMSITELSQRINESDLVVGANTGFVHLADSLRRPTVMVFIDVDPSHIGVMTPGISASVGDKGVVPEASAVLQAVDALTARPATSAPATGSVSA